MKTQKRNPQPKKQNHNDPKGHPGLALKLDGNWPGIEGGVLENMRMMVARTRKNGDFPKRLSVIATLSGEGVTSVSLGIGGTLANDYKARVCLVDLNWYSPSRLLCKSDDCLGIADVLENNVPLEKVIQPAGDSGLYILPAGALEDYKRPVIARSKALDDLLNTLDGLFDHLILDIPALLSTSDSLPLAAYGGTCCLVIQQGVTSLDDVKMGLDEISHLPILGVVINRVVLKSPDRLVRYLGG